MALARLFKGRISRPTTPPASSPSPSAEASNSDKQASETQSLLIEDDTTIVDPAGETFAPLPSPPMVNDTLDGIDPQTRDPDSPSLATTNLPPAIPIESSDFSSSPASSSSSLSDTDADRAAAPSPPAAPVDPLLKGVEGLLLAFEARQEKKLIDTVEAVKRELKAEMAAVETRLSSSFLTDLAAAEARLTTRFQGDITASEAALRHEIAGIDNKVNQISADLTTLDKREDKSYREICRMLRRLDTRLKTLESVQTATHSEVLNLRSHMCEIGRRLGTIKSCNCPSNLPEPEQTGEPAHICSQRCTAHGFFEEAPATIEEEADEEVAEQ